MKIEGKAAIVTGGGTGVGRATAEALARCGCSVLVNYSRSREDAIATVAELEKMGVRAVAFQADVADDDQCRKMVDCAVNTFGRLDVLINNAGRTEFIRQKDLDAVTDEVWMNILGVNLIGPFHCARAAAEPMRQASDGGVIVNVSSIASVLGKGSCIPYAASKAALNNLTIALARVFAPDIRVNAVLPGFITGRWMEQGLGDIYEPYKERFASKLPLQKVCEPADVADSVMSLVTGSDLITGQTLVCDGGMSIAKWNMDAGE